MALDLSDPLHPHFIIDPRGGNTNTVEWTQVQLSEVSVAAQLAVPRPALCKEALADYLRYNNKPKYHPNNPKPKETAAASAP